MRPIVISTCQAPNSEIFCQELAAYLTQKMSVPVEARLDISWQERMRQLDEGAVDACWICGLPYVWKADLKPPAVKLLAAPVVKGPRYQNRPVYYSDVVVRRSSPFKSFEDLRRASWAFNEPSSDSGYNVVRYALAERGEKAGFFGLVLESGAHQDSLRMILEGAVDASALDSTVLELELLNSPSLQSQIRVIESFGPSPIPPWVAPASLSADIFSALQDQFLGMQDSPSGRAVLNLAQFSHFVPVSDRYYDPIRHMAQEAEGVIL